MRFPYSLLSVVFVTALAFGPGLHNGFTNWDDITNFLDNPNFRGFHLHHLFWMFTAFHNGVYIPVTWLTLAWDYTWWGLNAFGYHLTSLAFHLANAALVYLLARRLLSLQADLGVERTEFAATLTALFFAIHPLRVESVAWVTERRDVVCGFFFLLTLLFYLDRRPRVILYLTFVLSLLSKATSMTLPLLLVLVDLYRAQTKGETVLWETVLRDKIPFAAIALVFAGLAWYGQTSHHMEAPVAFFTLPQRLGLSAYADVFYLVKTAWPTGLSPLYELHFPLAGYRLTFVLSVIAVVLISTAAMGFRRRCPSCLIVWLWYLIALFPNSGFFQTGMQRAADRYSYLPGLGLAFLVGGLFLVWDQEGQRPTRLAKGLAAFLVLGLGYQTFRQTTYWHDSIRLWQHAVSCDREAETAQTYLGTALMDQGDFAEAIPHLRRGLESPFTSVQSHNDLGVAWATQGQYVDAMKEFQWVLAHDPNNADAIANLHHLSFQTRTSPH